MTTTPQCPCTTDDVGNLVLDALQLMSNGIEIADASMLDFQVDWEGDTRSNIIITTERLERFRVTIVREG